MKVVFMGTPDFSVKSLEKLYTNGIEVCAVVTTPDRKSGRGMKTIPSPVKEYAIKNNIKIFQPEKISKNTEFKDEIRKMEPDLVCVVSYGVILPKSFLEIPKYGCINVHPSLLPKYRGSAPIQWAVLNGDEKTGVTIMYLNEQMDAGDIIVQKEVEIGENETTGELWERLGSLGADLLLESVNKVSKGTVKRIPQEGEVTFAPMLTKEMARIDWSKSTNEIKNLVRGLNPIMGAYSILKNKKIKFWKVESISTEDFDEKSKLYEHIEFKNASAGEILFANDKIGLFIKTTDGIISVLEIQGENAKKMSIDSYLRGNKMSIGEWFE